MSVAVICIGDELLSGVTLNTNANLIAKYLQAQNVILAEILTIADDVQRINTNIKRLALEHDLIITTGGLGATSDDVTKSAVSALLDCEMVFDEKNYARIVQAFNERHIVLTDKHREQCFFPEQVELVYNDMGTAPGMLYTYKDTQIMSLPGVPYEMKHLLKDKMGQYVRSLSSYDLLSHIFHTSGKGETQIALLIDDIINEMPEGFNMAYLPAAGTVRIQIKYNADKRDPEIKALFDKFVTQLRERMGSLIYSETDSSVALALGNELARRKMTLVLCESCTGGYLAHLITSNPGSSQYYMGSFVSYDNAFKTEIIGIDPKIIEQHGAVSEETVHAMAEHSMKLVGTDTVIAISGVAGPGGGTPEKPVGTFWLAWGDRDEIFTKKVTVNRERNVNIRYISNYVLRKLLLHLKNKS